MSEVDEIRNRAGAYGYGPYYRVQPQEAGEIADIIIRSGDSGEILWQLSVHELRRLSSSLPPHKKQELLDDIARELRIEALPAEQRARWRDNLKELGVSFGYEAVYQAFAGHGSAAARSEFMQMYLKGTLETGAPDNRTLHRIMGILAELSPPERNQALAGLSEAELARWAGRIGAAFGGLSGGEKRRLFDLLAPGLDSQQWQRLQAALRKEAPEVANNEFIAASLARRDRADVATSYIKGLLAGGGPFDDVSKGALDQIALRLAQLDPAERNRVLAGLSAEELDTWADEIGGAWGGWSGEEKQRLFDMLAGSLDGAQLTRFARSVVAKMPEAEGELVRAVLDHADSRTTADFLRELAAHASLDKVEHYPKLPHQPLTIRYGDREARLAVSVLTGLADRVPSGAARDAEGSKRFAAALAALGEQGLDKIMQMAAGRVDTQGRVAALPSLLTSSFEPGPLIRIIDAAARSGDASLKVTVLEAAARQLDLMEFADEDLQRYGLLERGEIPQVAGALHRLLGLPASQPQWTPPPDGAQDDGSGYFVEFQPEQMLQHLTANMPTVQQAAAYYRVDPRAIALITYTESKYNRGLIKDQVKRLHLGRGKGFGQMHDSAVRTLHPDWNAQQLDAARMNAGYAPALIAADMDAKARTFEMITAGQLSIRDNPLLLSWAYNSSLGHVAALARKAADSIIEQQRAGKSAAQIVVEIDLRNDIDLGSKGAAGHGKDVLATGKLDAFAAPWAVPQSPVRIGPEHILTR